MERVISEFRLVETDDGYRIEIKGDKEALRRAMGHGFGKRHFGRGVPPFFAWAGGPWRHHGHWHGCCEEEEAEPEPGEGQGNS